MVAEGNHALISANEQNLPKAELGEDIPNSIDSNTAMKRQRRHQNHSVRKEKLLLLGKIVSSTDNQYGNADSHISDTTSKIANDDFFNTNQEDNIHCHIDGHNVYVSDLGCEPADKVLNATPSKGKRGVKTKAATAPKSMLTKGKRVAKAKAAAAMKSMPTKEKGVPRSRLHLLWQIPLLVKQLHLDATVTLVSSYLRSLERSELKRQYVTI